MLHALVSQMSMISNRKRRLSSTQLAHKSLSMGFNHVMAPFSDDPVEDIIIHIFLAGLVVACLRRRCFHVVRKG